MRLRALLQAGLLCALFAGCAWSVAALRLPVPAGLLALGLLLALLIAGAVPERTVASGADLLLAVLGALFVPAGVGVVRKLPLLRAHGLALAAVLLASLAVGQLVTGRVAAWLARREAPPGSGSEPRTEPGAESP